MFRVSWREKSRKLKIEKKKTMKQMQKKEKLITREKTNRGRINTQSKR